MYSNYFPNESENDIEHAFYIHTYIHTYTHTYIHTYIHTYTHTHIQTYMHTYIHYLAHSSKSFSVANYIKYRSDVLALLNYLQHTILDVNSHSVPLPSYVQPTISPLLEYFSYLSGNPGGGRVTERRSRNKMQAALRMLRYTCPRSSYQGKTCDWIWWIYY